MARTGPAAGRGTGRVPPGARPLALSVVDDGSESLEARERLAGIQTGGGPPAHRPPTDTWGCAERPKERSALPRSTARVVLASLARDRRRADTAAVFTPPTYGTEVKRG
ncbi:MAG: hypothetical protein M0Z46_08535 [Actinomycetota bacterium]|nr:hypothetical protein [Actinomycetota bacterium]